MTTARAIEYRITRQLLRRREECANDSVPTVAERLITVAAVAVVLLVLGTCARELLWCLLAGAVVLTLGTRSG